MTGNTFFNEVASSLGATVNAMGYRRTDNFIYGINPTPPFFNLYRVGSDGVAIDLGIPTGMINDGHYYYAGDVTPDGNYLVLIGQKDYLDQEAVIAKVDLNDPDFQVTSLIVSNLFTSIYDIAFDPQSGQLYGFSTGTGRLVKINIDNGTITSSYPIQSQVNQLGALFFDVSGNLFGYGRISGSSTLVAIDKNTGIMTAVANGPNSGGEDGCSCPYTVALKKTVSVQETFPCTEVVYSFTINNATGQIQENLQLKDIMPEGFTVLEILSNPLGGTPVTNGRFLSINGLDVPSGSYTIDVLVEIGEDLNGVYQNQAVLSGLPTSLGEETVSDNPATYIALDSTPITIVPLEASSIMEEYYICPGEEVNVNAGILGVDYLWSDGTEDATHIFDSAGDYSVTISSGCEEIVADFSVNIDINYTYFEEEYRLCGDDTLRLDVSEPGATYLWKNGDENAVKLITEEGDYSVTVFVGCEQKNIQYHITALHYFVDIIEEDVTIELGDRVNLVANYWAAEEEPVFEWVDPQGNSLSCTDCLSPIASPLNTVVYTLSMLVDNCVYSDEVLVRVQKNRAVYIPNVFSPNDDGINDFFYVQSNRDNVRIKKMSIFDRWGNLVHQALDIDVNQASLGWDGIYNGLPAQSGVFVYMIVLEFIDGVEVLKYGDVTILR